MSWNVPFLPIDLVPHRDKVFICCKDGVYELVNENQPMELDEEDDIFSEKNHATQSSQEASLRVKFKREALSFCVKENVLFSMHKKSESQLFIEATDLDTFQCRNPSVWISDPQTILNSGKTWLVSHDNQKLILHCFDMTLTGELSSELTLRDVTVCKAQSKLELYTKKVIQRPKLGPESDILDRIIDEIAIESDSSGLLVDAICDINFAGHDLALIVFDKGQLLQYRKSGKTVCKSEIPISHVSLTRRAHEGCYVMTTYGAIYRLHLPYDEGDSKNNVQEPVMSIMESSRQLRVLNTKKSQLKAFTKQLQLALSDHSLGLQAEWEFREKNLMYLTVVNKGGHELNGEFWTLMIKFKQKWCVSTPFPMEKFAPDSKWKLKVKLDFEILFQDFPISMEASLIFQADSEMKVLCKPWLRTQLTSCDFLVIKSSMAIQESESKFFTDKELSFQDFLEATNNQRLLNISGTKEMKSVTVNVDKTNKLFLESAENTLYVQVLDSPMTLILDKEAGKITIRGRDLEQILGLKQDLLQCGEKSVSLGQIRQLQECLEDDNLDLCYKMLRLL